MKAFLFILFFSLLPFSAKSQWTLIDDVGGVPNSSAALQINSTSRGVLMPKITILQREAISNPSEGLMVYQTDSTKGIYFYSGNEWKIIGKRAIVNNKVASQIAVVRDVKPSGTDGGTFTSGSWQIRDLNDLRGDSSFITIDGSTTFTLDSGIYEISASAPARAVAEHQIRLFNITDNFSEIVGKSIRSELADPPSTLNSVIRIDSQKTFRIEHRCSNSSGASVARGTGVNWGENVYTQVRIQKL